MERLLSPSFPGLGNFGLQSLRAFQTVLSVCNNQGTRGSVESRDTLGIIIYLSKQFLSTLYISHRALQNKLLRLCRITYRLCKTIQ